MVITDGFQAFQLKKQNMYTSNNISYLRSQTQHAVFLLRKWESLLLTSIPNESLDRDTILFIASHSRSTARVKHSGYLRYTVISKLLRLQNFMLQEEVVNYSDHILNNEAFLLIFQTSSLEAKPFFYISINYIWCFLLPNSRTMINYFVYPFYLI